MFETYPDILTVPQVANALGIGRKAAYTLVNENRLGCIRFGRNIKVPKYCLIEFVESARENVNRMHDQLHTSVAERSIT